MTTSYISLTSCVFLNPERMYCTSVYCTALARRACCSRSEFKVTDCGTCYLIGLNVDRHLLVDSGSTWVAACDKT